METDLPQELRRRWKLLMETGRAIDSHFSSGLLPRVPDPFGCSLSMSRALEIPVIHNLLALREPGVWSTATWEAAKD